MTPHYADDDVRTCRCGCGEAVSGTTRRGPRQYVTGHNLRGLVVSAAQREAMSAGCRLAWATKRTRKPIGSRRKDANGYWLIKVREGGGRWEKEHVLIAERELGRRLVPGEHVHHINCVRDDNRPENLVVLQGGEHTTAHASLNGLVAGLLAEGVVEFDRTLRRYVRA